MTRFRSMNIDTLDRLSRDGLVALAHDEVGALRVPNFFGDEFCMRSLTVAQRHLTRYDPKNYPVFAYKVGPALNEYRAPGGGIADRYWTEAERARRLWDAEPYLADMRTECHKGLAEAWDGPVIPASCSGRNLFWGIIREISKGTLIHWDDVTRELGGSGVEPAPRYQLALNVFLSVPAIDGEAIVWPQKWTPSDERHRLSFGYRPEVITVTDKCSINASVGDAIVFNSKNYHTVQPGLGGRRICFSTFIGLTDKELILWS
ncbi:hypothetical protein AB0K60_12285 [Thermopolyspora sp. NPDC052614]|uniref:hypothetical protein n=1 Tax=Thermopolyspora sp. NPDC052614 TaxID=3155682 RepID=UPI00341D35C0